MLNYMKLNPLFQLRTHLKLSFSTFQSGTVGLSTGNHRLLLKSIRHSINHRPFSYIATVNSIFTAMSNSQPVAYFQNGLIDLHNITGLPWWATIVLSTVLLRTVITLPLSIYQAKITARIELIAMEMPDIVKELKRETAIAVRQFGWTEKQARVMYNRSFKREWKQLIERENCHPMKTMCVAIAQIPLWIVQSVSIRNLVMMLPDPTSFDAAIIYTELTLGGFGWIPNLTEVDSSLILPVTLGIINLSIIEIQMMSRRKITSSRLQRYTTNFFRCFTILMVSIAATVPSSLCVYWATSSAYGLAQNLLLMSPKFKRFVRIPPTPSQLDQPYRHLWSVMGDRITSAELKLIAFGEKVILRRKK